MGVRVVLYVEDEDAAVFLLETALNEAKIDLQLHRVSNGEDALAFLNRTGVYRNAPRKSGLEVLSDIHTSEALRNLSVVVFTSSSLAADRMKSLALGAQEYITKPSSFDGFLTAIRTVCNYLPAN
jgi:CheY-like chemotaxis protein